jgi:hypothetical protein
LSSSGFSTVEGEQSDNLDVDPVFPAPTLPQVEDARERNHPASVPEERLRRPVPFFKLPPWL